MRILYGVFGCCFLLLVSSCQREHRDIRPSPARLAIFSDAARESPLRPGGPVQPQPQVTNPYNSSAYDISEGQRLMMGTTAPAVTRMVGAGSARP
ncbi:MAG: hypothetical protein ACR2IV_22475 [Bryobacteraceae bacterium]